ncbi:hypothetical protein EYF80_019273 [Liparis tanakae]|uniref:Uncharacterized protein n=1 Tax=Liparis tanakae TaxID=230148 RepID=A0A4Z2HXZ6_9TELE|nr:hypothetical protein EYF80_019273 [Liparis tanakae]
MGHGEPVTKLMTEIKGKVELYSIPDGGRPAVAEPRAERSSQARGYRGVLTSVRRLCHYPEMMNSQTHPSAVFLLKSALQSSNRVMYKGRTGSPAMTGGCAVSVGVTALCIATFAALQEESGHIAAESPIGTTLVFSSTTLNASRERSAQMPPSQEDKSPHYVLSEGRSDSHLGVHRVCRTGGIIPPPLTVSHDDSAAVATGQVLRQSHAASRIRRLHWGSRERAREDGEINVLSLLQECLSNARAKGREEENTPEASCLVSWTEITTKKQTESGEEMITGVASLPTRPTKIISTTVLSTDSGAGDACGRGHLSSIHSEQDRDKDDVNNKFSTLGTKAQRSSQIQPLGVALKEQPLDEFNHTVCNTFIWSHSSLKS